MHSFFHENIQHILFLVILVARISDIVTTYLATPHFKLEANPLVRRFKGPVMIISLALSLLPYLSIKAAIIILVVSVLVSLSNSMRLWLVRALGEEEYYRILLRGAAIAHYRSSIFFNVLPGLIMLLLAASLFMFYPDPETDMGFYFALGTACYAVLVTIHFPRSFLRTRREAIALGKTGVE